MNINKNEPIISIITVVKNGIKTIEQTIKSVMFQSYKNIEYVVIDGGSNDGTINIIKSYEKNIKYWISEPDQSMYAAINKGIKLTHGEIVGIINSDDLYYPWTVEEVVRASKTTNADIFHGNLVVVSEFSRLCHFSYAKPDINKMFYNPSIFHPTCFVKRSVYDKIGLFDENFKLISDYDFLLRALENNIGFYHIDKSLAVFKVGGASSSGKGWAESMLLLKKHPLLKCSKWKIYKNSILIPIKKYIKKRLNYNDLIEKKYLNE